MNKIAQLRHSCGFWIGVLLAAVAFLVGPTAANPLEKEMTFTVEAGRNDCFYQAVAMGETIDLEYQVIDGGHGDLDISFALTEPTGRILYADYKKSDNVHRHQATVAGDYALCFDNTISRFNKKTVFLELMIENEDADGAGIDDLDNWPSGVQLQGLTAEEVYEMKVEDIQSAIARVRGHLTKARQTQDVLRSHEARDRNVAETNNALVQMWSMCQIGVMLVVGGLQVVMVRSLFETDASVTTIWKRLSM